MTENADKGSLLASVLRRLWRLFAIGFGLLAVIVAIAIGLFRVLVPMVPDYHQRIEQAASDALGYPVRLHRIDARWRLRGPELVFEGAKVLDGETGATLISARDGYVNLDVGALLSDRRVVPDNVLLRGVDIELVRDTDGSFAVFGHRPDADEEGPARTLGPLPTGRFELRDARLRYIDGDAAPIEVPDLEIDLEVGSSRLRLDGTLTPPAAMGDGIEVSIEVDGPPGRLTESPWQVYAAGSDVDLAAVAALIDRPPTLLASGRGDAVLWAAFEGSALRNATLEIDLADVALGDDSTLLPYDRVSGRLEWDAADGGWRALANELYLARGGDVWPHVDVSVDYTTDDDEAAVVKVISPFVRIEDLQPVLSVLPESEAVTLARSLAPHGELYDLDLTLRLPREATPSATVDVRAQRVGWTGHERIPGVSGLSGLLRIDDFGGRVDIDSEQLTVQAPALLRDDLEAWRLAGTVVWRREEGGWQVMSDRVLLATAEFDALSRFTVERRAGAAGPVVDLDIELGDLDLAATRAYLPAPVMKPKLVKWLDDALQGGTVQSASLDVQGPLNEFPFDAGGGHFKAELDVEDVVLGFARGWPAGEAIDAVIRFEGRSLEASVSDGRFGEMRLSGGEVGIADLTKDAVLDITARSDAQLQDLEAYILSTPVAVRYQGLFDKMVPAGPVAAEFSMSMPLRQWREFEYRLAMDLNETALGYAGWRYQLESMTGKVMLSNNRIDSEELSARLLGRPVDLLLQTEFTEFETADGPQPVSIVVASATGTADANVLAERLYAPLAGMLSGTAAWQAQARFPPFGFPEAQQLEISLESDMNGMAVTLPAPVGKSAADSGWPLAARLEVADGGLYSLDVDFGANVHALLELASDAGTWSLARGDLALGGGRAKLEERPGLRIHGGVEAFDLGEWLDRLRGGQGGMKLSEILRTMDVEVAQLAALGQNVEAARVKVDRNVREWLIEVESERADGAIFYPFDPSDGTPVIVNMQRLHWQSGDDGVDDTPTDPRTLPALRVDVQDFTFNAWQFGALTMALDPVEDGLSLQRFTTTDPSFSGTADGVWRHAGGAPSEFRFRLVSSDVQATLGRLNSVEAIDADEASLDVDVRWDGHLDAGIVSDAYGELSVRIGEGKLLSVDPKAGRVFGLMSITALPRRLSLDFSDIFGKGFAFDAIEGDFTLRDGSAFTENLTLRGPAAQVAIVGRAGIAERDYDQTAVVYANFGSSLPIAGAIAGGPAVGAALLIFSEVFKDPLKEIGRVDYRITGSWDEPAIARILQDGSSQPAASVEGESPSG